MKEERPPVPAGALFFCDVRYDFSGGRVPFAPQVFDDGQFPQPQEHPPLFLLRITLRRARKAAPATIRIRMISTGPMETSDQARPKARPISRTISAASQAIRHWPKTT